MVESWILNNSGSRDEVQDLFQEALIVLVHNLRKKEFKFTASPSTFLFAIAKRLWLKQLRKKKTSKEDLSLDEDNRIEVKELDWSVFDYELENIPDHPMHSLAIQCFNNLGEKCQSVVRFKHVLKISHNEIAEELDISVSFSRLKLNKCMEQLRKSVKTKN